MFDKLKQLFTGKKFLVMVAGLLVAFAARYGLNLDETEVAGIIVLFVSWIVAQGQADKNKEAEKVKAIAAITDAKGESASKQIEAIKSV